jgi:hypothetical protein
MLGRGSEVAGMGQEASSLDCFQSVTRVQGETSLVNQS